MPTAKRSAAGSTAPASRPRAGTTKATHARRLACLLVAVGALFAAPAASASPSQFSLIQDDRELFGASGFDPAQAMSEFRELGADVIRTNVIYHKIYRTPKDRRKPRDFRASDPGSSHYDWSATDRLVELARKNGLGILMTVTGPGPFFTSAAPRRCRELPCSFKPNPREFGAFAAAAVKRYSGKVNYYSIWNEPNIGKTWLSPRYKRTRFGRVDLAGAIYRKLYLAGYKAVARYDRRRRNRVLFGETAAIGSPLPMLNAALCLDGRGRPFRGRLRRLQGCAGRIQRLNIGGVAVHPYNSGAFGNAQSRTRSKTALPLAYMPRLHRLLRGAVRRGRIGRRGRNVFVTEFGFQTKPPDPFGVSLGNQARFLNESDRLFYGDRRIKSVAQYELHDVPEANQFNTGLRFSRERAGRKKPAYDAYRVPLVVTRRSRNSVEVYGQVRPSRLLRGGPVTRVNVLMAKGSGTARQVASPLTNRRGIFRIRVNRRGASSRSTRWRIGWRNGDTGEVLASRVARAGKRLRYYRR